MILGSAELTSGIFSGFLMYYTSPKIAFQSCAVIGIVFNAVTLFLTPAGSLISYVTLFIAILGVGGIYTCLYVLIPILIPKHQTGGAFVLIVTIGTFLSLFAPMIVLESQPIPFMTMVTLISIALFSSCFLNPSNNISSKPEDERLAQLNDNWVRECESPAILPLSKRRKFNVSCEDKQVERKFMIGARFHQNYTYLCSQN